MNRGEVWWVTGIPTLGREIQKERPAVIVSSDSSNRHLNRVQVVPLTRNVVRAFPGEAIVTVNGESQKAAANQISTVSKERLTNRAGRLSRADLSRVEQALLVQLDLPR